MLRRLLAVLPILLVLGLSADPPKGSTTFQLLVERAPESLRGQAIDLDDHWSAARLLAHFGESKLAYDLLREGTENGAADAKRVQLAARVLTELGLFARADSVLSLHPAAGDPHSYYLYCLQRSRLHLMARNFDRSLRFLSRIDTLSVPIFEPYRDYLELSCLVASGRFDEACEVGETRLAKGIPVSLSPQFEEQLLEAYLNAEKYESAQEFIERLRARKSRSSAIARVLIAEVDILLQMGDTLVAVERAMKLVDDRRTRVHALDLVEGVTDRVALDAIDDKALLKFCGVVLRGKNLTVSNRIMSELFSRKLDKGQREELRFYRGDLYFQERRYNSSYKYLRDRFTSPPLERRATLLRARIFRKTGQRNRSAGEYVNFATKYPYDGKAAEALIVAAGLYLESGNRARSMDVLERITKTYPSHRYSRIASKKMAMYHMGQKRYSRGVEILETAVQRTRRRNEDLLYYLADAYRRMDDVERSQKVLDELYELDPLSFYLGPRVDDSFMQPLMTSDGRVELYGNRGLLEFLKHVFHEREASYQSIRAVLDRLPDPKRSLDASEIYLERGRRFLQMGFRDWAELELRTLESQYRLPVRFWFELGILYDDFAMHWRSVRAFQRVYYAMNGEERKPLQRHFTLLMHPIPYPALVMENCARYGVSPHLVYAMMRQESRFDLNAVSRAGAMGLMQLMPRTSDHVAGRLGFPQGIEEDLFTPEINLTFGIWYAAHLLTQTEGNTLMMLSAYNAGLGNARRWFNDDRRAAAIIAMVDEIDYGETRNYVKKIVESAKVYHAFYFGAALPRDESPR